MVDKSQLVKFACNEEVTVILKEGSGRNGKAREGAPFKLCFLEHGHCPDYQGVLLSSRSPWRICTGIARS